MQAVADVRSVMLYVMDSSGLRVDVGRLLVFGYCCLRMSTSRVREVRGGVLGDGYMAMSSEVTTLNPTAYIAHVPWSYGMQSPIFHYLPKLAIQKSMNMLTCTQ